MDNLHLDAIKLSPGCMRAMWSVLKIHSGGFLIKSDNERGGQRRQGGWQQGYPSTLQRTRGIMYN